MSQRTSPVVITPSTREATPATVPPARRSRKPHQCGAICWKTDDTGRLVVLLITSRRTGRWVIPKGNIRKRENQYECARREAFEEAGVTGRIGKKTIGQFVCFKPERSQWLTVSVFPLLVSNEVDEFPEMDIRERRWFPAQEAAACLDEPDLGMMLQSLANQVSSAKVPPASQLSLG